MMFSTSPTTRSVSSRDVPTGMRTLSMIMSMSWAGMNSVPRKGTMARERTRARMAPPRTQRRWWRAQSSRFRYQARGLANWRSSGDLGDGLEALLRSEEEGRGQGNDGQGDEERGQEGEGDGQAEGLGHLAGDARGEDHGEEDDDRRQGRGRDGHADLGGPGDDGLVGSLALLEMPVDVLDDDDGVVDEHADAQGQAVRASAG